MLVVKNLPANAGDIREGIQSLGGENPLEEGGLSTPVLSGQSHGQRNLAGYSPWGCQELDMTEELSTYGCLNSTCPFFFQVRRLAQRS